MKSLIIDAIPDSPYYPEVNFNAETGVCVLSGESYMEEAYKFYTPLLNWLKEYTLELKQQVTLNIKLTYFNTNSSRLLLDMLDILKKALDKSVKVTINWYFEQEDPDIKEEVEDFEIETGLIINMIPFD
jgi:DNA modification methylase